MNNEQQVVSLEISKQLRALDVGHGKSIFYWDDSKDNPRLLFYKELNAMHDNFKASEWDYYSAFTVAELGEMLPASIVYDDFDLILGIAKIVNEWITIYYEEDSPAPIDFRASTLADSMGLMLIYLIENGHVKL